MKLLLEHELPKRLRYARVYMELASASLFFSLDGTKASLYGSIGANTKPVALSDPDYAKHRTESRVVRVVDEDEDRFVVETENGVEEEWVRPKWVLVGVRKAREDGSQEALCRKIEFRTESTDANEMPRRPPRS